MTLREPSKMSNAMSALNAVSHEEGIAQITEVGLRGMITLRGDLSDAQLIKAAEAAAGVPFPEQNRANTDGLSGLCWMSPDEVLILCPHSDAPARLAQLQEALAGSHVLAVNVSDARAVFALSGPHAREVLAKLVPVNLAPGAFEPGMFRRTRMSQIAAAFWMADAETFHIITFRSTAQYAFDLLKVAAAEGSEVGYFNA